MLSLVSLKEKNTGETEDGYMMLKRVTKDNNYENYGSTTEELQLLVGKPFTISSGTEYELAELIYNIFQCRHSASHQSPKTNPKLPPVRRGKRHRNYYIYQLNEFRHWWKTSRLLVRLAGGTVLCRDVANWENMATLDVNSYKQFKMAAKMSKTIGKGGSMSDFLDGVNPYTRTIRIILAIARAVEAKVDNRLYEVGIAEAFAFFGNRSSRYFARSLVDWLTRHVALPFSAVAIAPYLDQQSRPVIVVMGFLRAILPFMASFEGSRIGRQLTYNTFSFANYRWKPVQNIMHFHELTGTYQDTNLDPELLSLARSVAEKIGHGQDPSVTRANLAAVGFKVFGTGSGGHSIYRLVYNNKIITLHTTPYGPSILGELPFYILLERRHRYYVDHFPDIAHATILDAATPREAKVQGFTYSGAFFQVQEWAALRERYDREIACYSNACRIMNTQAAKRRNPQSSKAPVPPDDLPSLKAFIRTGRFPKKQRRDNTRWRAIQHEVKNMSDCVARYQQNGTAPSRVILYLEGLDCAGKSSTGMLICDALEKCGYEVKVAQHNRPPTEEQKMYPWMSRVRFEYPEDMYENYEKLPNYSAVVWDRGPAGDFVYGKLNELSVGEKLQRYREFREYDYRCRRENVLFCKIFFVTDKDSIAATLGKRLAHKQIAQDLRAWLDANSVKHYRQGLENIDMHIDPTDFMAFNRYEENIKKFSEFVRNTDYVGHVGLQEHTKIYYNNPWLVVNTSDRHKARLNIMKAFELQLKRHATIPLKDDRVRRFGRFRSVFARNDIIFDVDQEHRPVPNTIVEEHEHGLSLRAVFQTCLLACLLYIYVHYTLKVSLDFQE